MSGNRPTTHRHGIGRYVFERKGLPGRKVCDIVREEGNVFDKILRLALPIIGGMASQKNHMSLYLMGMYLGSDDMKALQAAWKKTGKPMDMGKSCIRFKRIEDLPLEVIGAALDDAFLALTTKKEAA